MNIRIDNQDIVMKLLHYFITEKNYNPVVLYGAKDEIWLENLESDYKIIRIVSNYIHNDEQMEFDLYRTEKIMKSIKKKTLSLNMPTLSLFLNVGDNVNMDKYVKYDYIDSVDVKDINDVVNSNYVKNIFVDINKVLNYKEEGMDLFIKLTTEINKKNEAEAIKSENVFKPKKPYVTYAIIAVNIIVFILMYILGNGSTDNNTLINFGANNRFYVVTLKEYYRLITCAFLHIGLIHLVVNLYSLYVIGSSVESFFGKTKYLVIYFISILSSSLLSIVINKANIITAGASGAIFGLLGALLYFGYHYRLYLGSNLKTQIIPIILLNLFIGFMSSGIDNAAHIGGLIGGFLISMILGVKYKSKKSERINGIILLTLFFGFMIFLITKI